jgi:hypothetical protein
LWVKILQVHRYSILEELSFAAVVFYNYELLNAAPADSTLHRRLLKLSALSKGSYFDLIGRWAGILKNEH